MLRTDLHSGGPSLADCPGRPAEPAALLRPPVEWAILAVDLAGMALALGVTRLVWSADSGTAAALAAALVMCFVVKGHYSARKPFFLEAKQILIGTAVTLGLLLSVQATVGWPGPGAGVAWFGFVACLSLIAGRLAAKYALYLFGIWPVPTVLVGPTGRIQDFRQIADQNWYLGYVITDVLPISEQVEAVLSELNFRLANGAPRHIIVVFDHEHCRVAELLVAALDRLPLVTYGLVPPISALPFADLSVQRLFGHDGLLLHRDRIEVATYRALVKRAFDLVTASLLLLLLAPLLLAVAVAVRVDGGPALYGSPRLGRNGREFRAYKFRSMVPDAEHVLRQLLVDDPLARREWEEKFKLTHDPRITSLGRVLRKTSLDELPQLLNVLRGEMSLVGPRPLLPEERQSYGDSFALYREVAPGMTGMWQVCGRDQVEYARRVSLNDWYCRNGTIWNDLVILMKTARIVFRQIGAS